MNTWLWFTAKPVVWTLSKSFFRVRAEGKAYIPRTGPVLVVSNHCSYLDPVLLGVTFPRTLRFLAKSELFDVSLLKFLMRQWGQVPVYRSTRAGSYSAIRAAIDLLKRGEAVVVFPEGTRSVDGRFHPEKVHTGAAVIALQAEAPVIPAAVVGSFQALPKGSRFPRPYPVRVIYGSPLDMSEFYRKENSPDLPKILTEKIIQRILALLPESLHPVSSAPSGGEDSQG